MSPIKVCPGCERLLDETSQAMRRHASDMHAALDLIRSGGPSGEQEQDFRAKNWASFNEAQRAWDVYREHLIEHGILPAPE